MTERTTPIAKIRATKPINQRIMQINAQESDFAEALMGHKSLKLVYYKQSFEERQKMYKKLEPNLTISDFSKVEKTMEEMQSQIETLTLELEKVKQWKEITVKYPKKA